MKYYIDDDDRAYYEEGGIYYRLGANGEKVKTNRTAPDSMKWTEVDEKEAIKTAKLYESYFEED